jgi:hypothetical protein
MVRQAVRLSPLEVQRVKTAAKVNRQTPSEFVRDAIAIAVDDCLESLPVRRNS